MTPLRTNINRRYRRESPDNNQLIQTHLNNINSLCNIIQQTNELIQTQNNSTRAELSFRNLDNYIPTYTTRYNRTSRNQRRTPLSRDNPSSQNNSDSDTYYQFTIDTFFPFDGLPNRPASANDLSYNDLSYNILKINENNRDILLDSSYNNYDIFDISEYRFIIEPKNDICPITRESFCINQNVSMVCKCRHIFNESVLKIWLNNNNTCPYCRTAVRGE